MAVKWRKGWKVVTDAGVSVAAPAHACVTYAKGMSTRPLPHCGPLCVFAERQHAEDFVNYDLSGVRGMVRACRYRRAQCKTIWARSGRKFWRRRQLFALPAGTVLAVEVVLEE